MPASDFGGSIQPARIGAGADGAPALADAKHAPHDQDIVAGDDKVVRPTHQQPNQHRHIHGAAGPCRTRPVD